MMDFKQNPNTDFRDVDELSQDQAQQEIEALRNGIDYHDYRYYVKNDPVISDAVYDQLLLRLEELEAVFPDLQSANSPTQRVGAEPVSELKKVEHEVPLLSLQATLEKEEVGDFIRFVQEHTENRSTAYSLEPKFDGLSVAITYQEGQFQVGATRGNGEIGEDISHNLRTIAAIPLRLRGDRQVPPQVTVRAEVFLRKSGFLTLNKQRIENGEEPFANPRNAAAGMMRQLDSRRVAGKPFDIFFYEVLASSEALPETHREVFVQVNEEGWLVLHFGMTGHLQYLKKPEEDSGHNAFVLVFVGGNRLVYVSQRKLGKISMVAAPGEWIEKERLGPDAFSVNADTFRTRLTQRRGAIKSALMNQAAIAGLGNVYADEILFQAGLHPKASVQKLDSERLQRVFDVMHRVLEDTVACQADPQCFPQDYLTPHREPEAPCPRCAGKLGKDSSLWTEYILLSPTPRAAMMLYWWARRPWI